MTASLLPDAAASRAVLVGVSRYRNMPENRQLPAVENNLRRLAELLCDPRVWGLPAENCVVLHQPGDADAVIGALRMAAESATASLVFYYAGHGLIDPLASDDLYLALPGSREPAGTHLALNYRHVRAELLRAAAVPQKVVMLDCCWSGKVLRGTMGGGDLANVAAVSGTAVLTACASTARALSPPGEDYTAFTGALAKILDEGIAGGPPELDIGTLYRTLDGRLGSDNRPRPQLGTSESGSELVLARNTGRREHTGTPGQPAPPPAVVPAPAPLGEHIRPRIRELLRTGRYEEARELRLQLAEAGDREALREVVTQLQREGQYQPAARLEKAAPAGEEAQELLRRLRQSHRRKT